MESEEIIEQAKNNDGVVKVNVTINDYFCKMAKLDKCKMEDYFFIEQVVKILNTKRFKENFMEKGTDENGQVYYKFAFLPKNKLE